MSNWIWHKQLPSTSLEEGQEAGTGHIRVLDPSVLHKDRELLDKYLHYLKILNPQVHADVESRVLSAQTQHTRAFGVLALTPTTLPGRAMDPHAPAPVPYFSPMNPMVPPGQFRTGEYPGPTAAGMPPGTNAHNGHQQHPQGQQPQQSAPPQQQPPGGPSGSSAPAPARTTRSSAAAAAAAEGTDTGGN